MTSIQTKLCFKKGCEFIGSEKHFHTLPGRLELYCLEHLREEDQYYAEPEESHYEGKCHCPSLIEKHLPLYQSIRARELREKAEKEEDSKKYVNLKLAGWVFSLLGLAVTWWL